MTSITLALLMISPARGVALQRPPVAVSPYGQMTEREWILAMSNFVFGADPEQADKIQRDAEEVYRKSQRQAEEDHLFRLAKREKAKATLQQLITEFDAMLVPEVRGKLPPAEVVRAVRLRSMLLEILIDTGF